MKVVLFNGPPRSGKDTATQMALDYVKGDGIYYRFAEPLKDAVHALFGMANILQEHFDAIKSIPSDLFFGMNPRQAYIWMSEEVAKPKFGNDFFAKIAVRNIKKLRRDGADRAVISDCGFQVEVDVLVEEFGAENVHVVHLLREGTSFQNDSRSYIDHLREFSHVINNNGSFDDLRDAVNLIMEGIKDDHAKD